MSFCIRISLIRFSTNKHNNFKVFNQYSSYTSLWYLDDGTFIGPRSSLNILLTLFSQDGPAFWSAFKSCEVWDLLAFRRFLASLTKKGELVWLHTPPSSRNTSRKLYHPWTSFYFKVYFNKYYCINSMFIMNWSQQNHSTSLNNFNHIC